VSDSKRPVSPTYRVVTGPVDIRGHGTRGNSWGASLRGECSARRNVNGLVT